MTMQIIDASVAAKWFLPDEPFRIEALAVLDLIGRDASQFAVPDFFYCEMLSVLCKSFDDVSEIQSHMKSLQDVGWIVLSTDLTVLDEATSMTKENGLSAYDAIYAANAKLTGGIWITADARAHKRIQKLRISKLL